MTKTVTPGHSTTIGATRQVLCRLDDIVPGRSKGVLANNRGRARVLLVRTPEGIKGYINTCPHYNRAPLGWKKDEFRNGKGDRIMCAAHGALFRIEDGVCVIGPCLGQALTPVPVWVEDGTVIGELAVE